MFGIAKWTWPKKHKSDEKAKNQDHRTWRLQGEALEIQPDRFMISFWITIFTIKPTNLSRWRRFRKWPAVLARQVGLFGLSFWQLASWLQRHPFTMHDHHWCWSQHLMDLAGAEPCINSLIRKSRAAFYADDYVKHTTHTTMKVIKKIQTSSKTCRKCHFFWLAEAEFASVRPSRTHR